MKVIRFVLSMLSSNPDVIFQKSKNPGCLVALPPLLSLLPGASLPLLPGKISSIYSKIYIYPGECRRGGHGLPPPGDNLPFSINNRLECWTPGHSSTLQVQADCLLHRLLWVRPDRPILRHEAPAPQEIDDDVEAGSVVDL